jgi:hypothetical protein
LQLLNLLSSESFTNELVTIIGERVLDALSEFDNPRKRGAEDTADGDELAAATPNDDECPTRRRKSRWNWERARSAVFDDYMCDTPTFTDRQFERMFRISKTAMQELRDLLGNEDDFFTEKTCRVTGKRTICPDVKILIALKTIAYGTTPHAFLDYFQMGETTARQCVIRFANAVSNCEELKQRFFRPMTRNDAKNVCKLHKDQHGIDGMIGSLDCMHVYWKNCPVAWQGQYQGKEKYPTIVLEAMCDYNLYFWHHEFGAAGTLNDISIWDLSGLHKTFVDGTFADTCDFPFMIDGKQFDRLWVTVDGIYPKLSRFVKTLSQPVDKDQAKYAKWQEKTRKDIERGFGVLQSKFRILTQKVELWSIEDIISVTDCCLLLHNWMVTVRLSRDESESNEWYDVTGDGSEQNGDSGEQNGDGSTTGNSGEQNGGGMGGGMPTGDSGVNRGNDANNQARNQNVATSRDDIVTAGNFIVDVTDPRHTQYQQACLHTRERCINDRWMHLYDAENFYRLQNAIINELKKINWNFE